MLRNLVFYGPYDCVPDKKRRGVPWVGKDTAMRQSEPRILPFCPRFLAHWRLRELKKGWKPPGCSTGIMMSMIKIFIVPVENNHFVLFCFVLFFLLFSLMFAVYMYQFYPAVWAVNPARLADPSEKYWSVLLSISIHLSFKKYRLLNDHMKMIWTAEIQTF